MMDIATALIDFMHENGIKKQKTLAALLETSQQNVSNWLKGKTPRGDDLQKVNHLLATYKAGQPVAPLPEKRRVNSAVTEIHEIPVALGRTPPKRFAQTNEAKPYVSELIRQVILELGPTSSFQEGARIEYQGMCFEVDFLSPNVCAEIKASSRGPVIRQHLDLGLYQLITLRHVLERLGRPCKRYALFLLQHDFPPRVMTRLLSTAALHDIHVFAVGGAKELAEILGELDSGVLKDDEFDDY